MRGKFRMSMFRMWLLLAVMAMYASVANAQGGVTLAEKGQARCVVIVPANWMEDIVLPKEMPARAALALKGRQEIFRASVKDLALYLGKMSGTTVEVVTAVP